ncbi:hypothetical protein COCNU_06G019720 [Cocos nucifera]|uniref:Uncharacterized protein n=1 Tax=Cocos nucifera TaxID=13894 RepID=A0A8K0N3M0_COCNU|nr:hypothetical protein COCNU_06G019720 [Cocos nucifera]
MELLKGLRGHHNSVHQEKGNGGVEGGHKCYLQAAEPPRQGLTPAREAGLDMDGEMDEVDEALEGNRDLEKGGAVAEGAEGGEEEEEGRCGEVDGERDQQGAGEDEHLEGGNEELSEGKHRFKKVMG